MPAWTPAVLAALLGLAVGAWVNRAAGAFPWPPKGERTGERTGEARSGSAPGGPVGVLLGTGRRVAVRPPVVEAGTALLFALTAQWTGPAWDLPAFLHLAGVGVLLALVDLRHRVLPNRVLVPSYGVAAALLALAAAGTGEWGALLRAGAGAAALFAAFLALALAAPSGLGMGDVKLAALLGLHLGWVGWPELLLGAAAGFAVQAGVALLLLATRRVGLRGELPFGPAMLAGAALALAV